MKRAIFGLTLVIAALVGVVLACPPIPYRPVGIIECKQAWLTMSPSSSAAWNGGGNGVLVDVAPHDMYWLSRSMYNVGTGFYTLTSIIGAGHDGWTGLTQQQANGNCAAIEIWMVQATGSGQPLPSQNWTMVSRLNPNQDPSGGSHGQVVGWNVGSNAPPDIGHGEGWPLEASALGDILQISAGGTAINLKPQTSYLLLIRVVCGNQANYTNLCAVTGGENWDDGTGQGSGVPDDKFIDYTGKWCTGAASWKVGQQAIPDESIVWVYAPKPD